MSAVRNTLSTEVTHLFWDFYFLQADALVSSEELPVHVARAKFQPHMVVIIPLRFTVDDSCPHVKAARQRSDTDLLILGQRVFGFHPCAVETDVHSGRALYDTSEIRAQKA